MNDGFIETVSRVSHQFEKRLGTQVEPDRAFGRLDQVLGGIGRHVFNLGFTEVSTVKQNIDISSDGFKVPYHFEVMFISGWQEEKKDNLNCLLLEGFLQHKDWRLFFIKFQLKLVFNLDHHKISLKLVSMLPYCRSSVFLKQLTKSDGEECVYGSQTHQMSHALPICSKPSKVLAVKQRKLLHLVK